MIKKAIEKLEAQKKGFKGDIYGEAMLKDVHKALVSFCKQEEEFAQAIVQSEKNLNDCMQTISRMIVGNAISDLEAFRLAVDYYFPGAEIQYNMRINLIGSAAADTPPIVMSGSQEEPQKKNVFELSLDDLL